MPKPIVDAISVELQKLTGLGGLIAGAIAPYALAQIDTRVFGRSNRITGDELDLSKENAPWRLEVVGVDAVAIAIDVYDDRGDDGSKKLGSVTRNVGIGDLNKCLEIGGDFKLLCDVAGVRLAKAATAAVVPRTAAGTATRATLRAPRSAQVELTKIRGLYKPSAPGKPGLVRAEAKPDYFSQDNLGRAYLNSDLALNWTKNAQQLELSAKVTLKSGLLPKDAKLKWSVFDVDDPTNDDPGFHLQWGRYVDAGDYDAAGVHHGSRIADNEGKAAKNPPWEQLGAFTLSGATKQECLTEIVSGVSSVVFHCPDVAGDNFVIAVGLDTAEQVDRLGHQTGVITMWHRIQVDSIRMASGIPLPMDRVAIYFEPCCAQLDCVADRVVPDKQYISPTDRVISSESAKYVNSVFNGKPGWFCLVSALEPHPLPTIKGQVLFTGAVTLGRYGTGANTYEYIDIPGTHADADFAQLTFPGGTIGFQIDSPSPFSAAGNPMTRCWLVAHDAQPEFTAGDGSWSHAYTVTYDYSPRFTKHGASVKPGGYGMPASVQAKVMSPGAFYTSGISPPIMVGGQPYFAGRTVVFTHHGHYYDAKNNKPRPDADEELLGTIVHELVHAFGMPHKCGYFDFRAPRKKTCCMNYSPNWMINAAKELVPGTDNKTGNDVCGRHLKEVRRVHLEDNKGLKWK